MNSFFRAVSAVFRGLFVLILLPIAPVADDRIVALGIYEKTIDWSERLRQERGRWSILSWLRRAANRQRAWNVRGQRVFDEMQRRQFERSYAWKLQGLYALRILAIFWGYYAIGFILKDHYPHGYTVWESSLHWMQNTLDVPFRWIVENYIEKKH
jgi:hypothetical protein